MQVGSSCFIREYEFQSTKIFMDIKLVPYKNMISLLKIKYLEFLKYVMFLLQLYGFTIGIVIGLGKFQKITYKVFERLIFEFCTYISVWVALLLCAGSGASGVY